MYKKDFAKSLIQGEVKLKNIVEVALKNTIYSYLTKQ